MHPDTFKERLALRQAFLQQVRLPDVTINNDALTGCTLMAIQMARHLKMSQAEFFTHVTKEWALWEEFLVEARKVAAKQRGEP